MKDKERHTLRPCRENDGNGDNTEQGATNSGDDPTPMMIDNEAISKYSTSEISQRRRRERAQ